MIPVKIITFEEAKKKGLTDEGKDLSGEGICGIMCVAKKEKKLGAKEIFLEKYILRKNGKKELLFMHLDRMKDLKKKKDRFKKYMNQFNKIKGIESQKYIKDNNLIIGNQEI